MALPQTNVDLEKKEEAEKDPRKARIKEELENNLQLLRSMGLIVALLSICGTGLFYEIPERNFPIIFSGTRFDGLTNTQHLNPFVTRDSTYIELFHVFWNFVAMLRLTGAIFTMFLHWKTYRVSNWINMLEISIRWAILLYSVSFYKSFAAHALHRLCIEMVVAIVFAFFGQRHTKLTNQYLAE